MSYLKLLAALSVIVSAIWAAIGTWGSDEIQLFTFLFSFFLVIFAFLFGMWMGIQQEDA